MMKTSLVTAIRVNAMAEKAEGIKANIKQEWEDALALMEDIVQDHGVPRNIRRAVETASEHLSAGADPVTISNAVYALDDVSNDVNIPAHTRTDMWEIISLLENIKEKVKN